MSAQYLSRQHNKLVTTWVLKNYHTEKNDDFAPIYEMFNFGRYRSYLEEHPKQVFHCLKNKSHKVCLNLEDNECLTAEPKGVVIRAPSGVFLFRLEVSFKGGFQKCIEVMGQVYSQNFTIKHDKNSKKFELSEHYHQVITLAKRNSRILKEGKFVTELIYRFPVKNAKSHSDEVYPKEMNIRSDSLTAVSRFVTILYAPQDYMEEAVYFSAATTITAISTIDNCRRGLFEIIDRLQSVSVQSMSAASVVKLSRTLEKLVTDFLLNVEEPRFIGLLIPSLRLENFHECLSLKSQIDEKRSSLSALFEKLSGLIEAKKIQLEELRVAQDNSRRTILAIATGFISLIFLPPSIILSFFGADIAEVEKPASIFDLNTYGLLYLGTFGLLVVVFSIAIFLALVFSKAHKKRFMSE
jgi:hypothetical protein